MQTTPAKAPIPAGHEPDLIALIGKARRITRAAIGGKSASDEDIVKELFTVIAPQFQDRPGGYTRMARKSVRRGDGATIVVLEFVND